MLTRSYQNVGKKTFNFVKMLNSERCEKCANTVDLKTCSPQKMYLLIVVKWASIQLRASPPKLCSNLFSSRRFWITTITYIKVLTSRPVDAVQLIRWVRHVKRCHLPICHFEGARTPENITQSGTNNELRQMLFAPGPLQFFGPSCTAPVQ